MSKLIGVPQASASKEISYIPVSITDVNMEEVKEHFNKWKNENIQKKIIDSITLLKPNSVLVELYRYEKTNNLFLGLNEEPLKRILILPICKVIKSNVISPNAEMYSAGSLLYCNDDIARIDTNPTWLQWFKIMKNERPQPEGLLEPERETGLILEWRRTSKFVLDKFNATDSDNYRFVRTINDFTAKKED